MRNNAIFSLLSILLHSVTCSQHSTPNYLQKNVKCEVILNPNSLQSSQTGSTTTSEESKGKIDENDNENSASIALKETSDIYKVIGRRTYGKQQKVPKQVVVVNVFSSDSKSHEMLNDTEIDTRTYKTKSVKYVASRKPLHKSKKKKIRSVTQNATDRYSVKNNKKDAKRRDKISQKELKIQKQISNNRKQQSRKGSKTVPNKEQESSLESNIDHNLNKRLSRKLGVKSKRMPIESKEVRNLRRNTLKKRSTVRDGNLNDLSTDSDTTTNNKKHVLARILDPYKTINIKNLNVNIETSKEQIVEKERKNASTNILVDESILTTALTDHVQNFLNNETNERQQYNREELHNLQESLDKLINHIDNLKSTKDFTVTEPPIEIYNRANNPENNIYEINVHVRDLTNNKRTDNNRAMIQNDKSPEKVTREHKRKYISSENSNLKSVSSETYWKLKKDRTKTTNTPKEYRKPKLVSIKDNPQTMVQIEPYDINRSMSNGETDISIANNRKNLEDIESKETTDNKRALENSQEKKQQVLLDLLVTQTELYDNAFSTNISINTPVYRKSGLQFYYRNEETDPTTNHNQINYDNRNQAFETTNEINKATTKQIDVVERANAGINHLQYKIVEYNDVIRNLNEAMTEGQVVTSRTEDTIKSVVPTKAEEVIELNLYP